MPGFARRLARDRPDQAALADARQRLGWAELGDQLDRVANALLAADLGAERRVAVFAENAAETVIAHLGGILGSTSVVPIGFHHTVDEVAYLLDAAGARLVFAGPETMHRARDAAARLRGRVRIVCWRAPAGFDGERWEDLLGAATASEPPDDVAPRPNLLFTSGTTGRPKATELPPAMFVGGATMAEHLDLLAGHKFAPFGPHLVVGPLHHTGPLQAVRVPVAGVPVHVLGRFDAAATLTAIEQVEIATSVVVPTHLSRLLALPEHVREAADVSSLRHVVVTGAPCPPEVKRAIIDWWGPVLFESYGGTEVGTVTSITSQEWLERPTSVGRCVPQFEAIVVDADGDAVPAGTEGRVFFADRTGRGIEYLGAPEASAAVHLEPGTFTLGEIGFVDADGYVHLTDRSSDLVLSGGVNVYPAEAERVLAGHPEVGDVACVGLPHAEMGEQLVALVAPRDRSAPPTPAALDAWCREHLSGPKCPREFRFVDAVARTPMGKLDRRALRAAQLDPPGATASG